jgi:hypothetical protein
MMSRKYTHAGALLGCLCAVAALNAAPKADVATPQARAVVVKNAEKLLTPKVHQYEVGKIDLVNPFSPAKAPVKVDIKSARPVTDHEFLVTLAAQLNPTGVLVLGDQSLLLFGEKKVKVGEPIRITFDKETYEVELVDLSRTAFTVRLNNEQTTRSIKPAKTP